MRQVLDAVRDTALESLRLSDDYRKNGGVRPVIDTPHYIFSPGGSLFAAYRDAARAEPSHVRLLWDEYMEIVLQVSSTYQTKRIANAVEELASIDPFSENTSSLLGDISDELLQIEFENPKRIIRRKGKSKYAGRFVGKVEWRIYVDPHSKKVSVGKEEYAFTAYLDWVAMDMVLAAISRDDHGAVIT